MSNSEKNWTYRRKWNSLCILQQTATNDPAYEADMIEESDLIQTDALSVMDFNNPEQM